MKKNPREKVMDVFNKKSDGMGTMWTGHPNDQTIPIYAKAWGIEATREAIYTFLDDDCRWIRTDTAYNHPNGDPMFDTLYKMGNRTTLGQKGCFADAQSIADIEKYPWPDPDYFDFDQIYTEIDKFQDKAVFTGAWSPFFHLVADFFGMENYFIKMYDDPSLVHAVTERIIDFYVQANERFFSKLGNKADIMFFGNDFGTQLDLLISPENFRVFVLPYFKRLISTGKKHGMKILLHSCGSIYRIIPDLIDAGVDAIHPIQAGAKGMDAKSLSRFKNDIAFVGGIDAQSFFVYSTPEQIREEVLRVRDILGPNIIISPSHEEILPNIPPENILAMAKAARE
jgi:uroporphyrinogen decarboxylase